MKLPKFNNNGFTFIEVTVVIAILGLLLPVVFSIILTVAKQQTKIYRISEVKQQGDFVLGFMKSYLADNGSKIYRDEARTFELCSGTTDPDNKWVSQTGTDFYIVDRNDDTKQFRFFIDSNTNQLMFDDDGTIQNMTTSRVQVINYDITCFRKTTANPAFIMISYTVYYNTNLGTAAPEDTAILKYKTIVRLR